MNKNSGFSLMELLIVVVLLGIIAAFAVPSYQASVMKSRRADAMAAVVGLQMAQQKLRANCPFFAQTISSATACGGSAGASTVSYGTTSNGGHYNISIAAGSASGTAYRIVATPVGAQASDTSCNPMTLTVSNVNPDGVKAPANCWN